MKNEISLNDLINNESNFIPLFSSDDEEKLFNEVVPDTIALLPLRNTVLYPGIVIPITVGRSKSIRLAQEYAHNDLPIGVITQRSDNVEDPQLGDLYPVGTMARILKYVAMPDGNVTIIVQGIKRFSLIDLVQTEPFLRASITEFYCDDYEKTKQPNKIFKALISSLRDMATNMIKLSSQIPNEAIFAVKNIESPGFLIHFIASNLPLIVEEKQTLLNVPEIETRARMILRSINNEIQLLELKAQIQNKSKQEIDRQQREYYLNEQIKTIQKELGESPTEQAFEEIKKKAINKKWGKEVQAVFNKELQKLQRTNSMSPDFSIQVNYLELMVELPWNEYTEDDFDLKKARDILDKEHFGLDKVKQRIIEYIAVLKLKKDMKSPILCLVGPPGVGKTSLGRSIANALKRKYVRISLGGLRDESEIRGHRKTYIGAMPGRIIQSMKKVGSSNPVFVLDEIDKVLGMTVQGDPSAALLEVLDPEQNISFYDNYLEVGYDLSKVLFIATANSLNEIPHALLDRMEVIDISGYFIEEKINIAKKHLVPKQLKENGLKRSDLLFSDKILESIISDYTRESGVRNLERTIAKIIRHRAALLVQDGTMEKRITQDDLTKILGAPIFQKERSLDSNLCGIATGLAWTSVGGEILFIESVISEGKGNLTITGNLGNVMKESATIAFEFLKSHAEDYGIDAKIFQEKNIHIHVPEGATPKDGPSAGITLLAAIISSFTKRKIREKIAMTGEITLRGKLLPVGGLNEKVLAAKRAGIYDIVLSAENKKDIDDLNKDYIHDMNFHYFSYMRDAIDYIVLK